MRKKLRCFLSILLVCMMVLNVPMSVMASEQMTIAEELEPIADIQEETEEAVSDDAMDFSDDIQDADSGTEKFGSEENTEVFFTDGTDLEVTDDESETGVLSTNKQYQPKVVSDLRKNTEYTLPAVESTELYWHLENAEYDVEGNPIEELTVEWYKNTTSSYENAVLFKEGKDGTTSQSGSATKYFFCNPKVTSVIGTTYYFCKLTVVLDSGDEETLYSGIGAVTINAPETPSVGIITGEDSIGKIYVKAEDSVPKRTDLTDHYGNPVEDMEPMGVLFDYTYNGIYVYPSDTMTTVIARAAILAGVEIGISGSPGTGMGSYIYMIAGRQEFDRGVDSGWMGSLNGWYTNTGFDNYKISDGSLQPEDYISMKYTTDLGEDIGASFGDAENSKKLKALTIEALSSSGYARKDIDFLNGEFDPDVTEYDIAYHPVAMYNNWTGIQISPVAENENNKVRVYVDGKECRGKHQTEITEKNTVITVVIEDPNAEGGDKDAFVYTIRVHKDPELMENVSVEVKEITKNGAEYLSKASYVSESTSGLGNLYKAELMYDTSVEDYQTQSLMINLENLPENVSASVKYRGKTWQVENGKAVISEGMPFVGKRTYTICLKDVASGVEESYYLQLTKNDLRLKKYTFTPMLGSSEASYSEIFNGQLEGTWFQLNENGEETGKTGFESSVTDYRIYLGSYIDGIKINVADVETQVEAYCFQMSVNGAVVADSGNSAYEWNRFCGEVFKNRLLSLNEGENTVVLKLSRPDLHDSFTRSYTLHIVKKNMTVQELQEKIMSLPETEDLSYSRDKGTVESLERLYENLTEDEKSELSAEAAAKLQAAVQRIKELYENGRTAINTLKILINTYAGKVTESNYETYEAAVVESQQKLAEMTDWIYSTFITECAAEYKEMDKAAEIIKKGKIVANKTIGEPTDYIDDFMVCANAFNLSIDAYEKDAKAYPVNFKDYIASNPQKGGLEACFPYNTPGRLKWTIEDESIFRIDSEISNYVDKGFGGGNASYPNELYYMVPLKEGTTTFTVTLTDATGGKYYGQTPKMIVHVNSEGEASFEKLENKLTNINSLPYTSKYDTWYYWQGTEGAEFSFHVNGTDAKVEVLDYQGSGRTQYPVDKDGNVTVLLKDGYNPIEVTAVYEGKKVTQVYGLRAKVISYVLTNESRPGMPLKVGDQATIKITGLTTPVYKILRIYNPSQAQIYYDTDMPYQSQIVGTGTQYTIGAVTFTITKAGTHTLTNGRIYQRWWGEALYSETAQGNTGDIALQSDGFFSRIPDITFTAEENTSYTPDIKVHTSVKGGTTVKQGETVTISLEDMDLSVITDKYPLDTTNYYTKLDTAKTIFDTDIPGLKQIESEEYDCDKKNSLSVIKTLKFTIPEDTPEGTYTIKGGYVRVMHGMISFGIFPENMFQLQIDDIKITVEHGHSYGDWTVTKPATCTENGTKICKCSCGDTKTEIVPKIAHSYGSWTKVSDATVKTAEVRKRTCSVCGSEETKSVGNKLSPILEIPGKLTSVSMKKGSTKTMTVTMAKGDLVSSVKSSAAKVLKATLDKKTGKITLKALKKGTAKLTIKLASGKSRTYTVKVVEETVKTSKVSVTNVTNKKLTLAKGKTYALKTTLKPFTSTQKVTYDTSNKKVVTVTSKGKIKAVAPGKATITVTSGSKNVKIIVTVPGITNVNSSLTVKKNKTLTLEPKTYGISEKVVYTSSDPKVATVSSKGKVKGIKAGTAKITIKAGSYKKTVTVKVK